MLESLPMSTPSSTGRPAQRTVIICLACAAIAAAAGHGCGGIVLVTAVSMATAVCPPPSSIWMIRQSPTGTGKLGESVSSAMMV